MKFSESWLREWVNPPLDSDALSDQLTSAGLEVDGVEPVAGELSDVVVAKIVSVAKHPNADKLNLCEVDAGEHGQHSVVCGAPNVHDGMFTALALKGARLPDGTKIKRSKIRGVESSGMLCSARELGLDDDADGIVSLGNDTPAGTALTQALSLQDVSIEIDLTPNRGDCLGLAGIAREVGVLNRLQVNVPECRAVPASIARTMPITLLAPKDCPRYIGRIIEGIDPTASTPMWMREKLRRSGVRSVSAVVDVTNYVMLELGQPMHAFDLDKIDGEVRVRRADDGEQLTLLDDTTLSLDENALVIADASKAVALAGVMGGLGTAVSDETTSLLLEAAFFAAKTVAVESRRRGLFTDASHRYARGVDWSLQRRAMERATALLLEIVGGEASSVMEAVNEDCLPEAKPIRLRKSRIERVLGMSMELDSAHDIMARLGMAVTHVDDSTLAITPPSFRSDVTLEEDLLEELARVQGYDTIVPALPTGIYSMPERPEGRVTLTECRARLIARGFSEAITYSFVDDSLQRLTDPQRAAVALANPISSELSVMRTQLWPGLLGALMHNLNRQQSRIRLFEAGLTFVSAGEVQQKPMIAGIATGSVAPQQWGVPARAGDYFDLKGDVEALLSLGSRVGEFDFVAEPHPALHPGQCARIYRGEEPVGWLGALHPSVARKLKLSASVYLFELSLDAICTKFVPKVHVPSRFPAVRRDISLSVAEAVSAKSIADCVGQVGVDMLEKLELFDVYRGEGVDSGQKSLALGLTFQASSRTLSDAEVEAAVTAILDSLAKNLGANLRG